MVNATHLSYDASDRSFHSFIKKEVHQLAVSHNFTELRVAEIDIILAEMTSNLFKYANGGEILTGYFEDKEQSYIELISIDNGPGMNDLSRMMVDGYSSSNTVGHGFGSMKRLSDHFEAFSAKGWGTIMVSRVYKVKPAKNSLVKNIQLYSLVVSKPGETVSGDGHYYKIIDNNIKILVGDGLGHGPEANKAVNEAVNVFKLCIDNSPVEIIRYIHPDVRKTRGLVATVAVFDIGAKQLRIAGVGNIATKLSGLQQTKNIMSYNGIIGHNIPNTMNDTTIDFTGYNQLVLCSDGIRSRWEINNPSGLSRYDISLQAVAIYKDYARRTDDMSVMIVKF
jgi:anti-sigma regulatory factor (Ser/Thr protein kinase)